MFYTLRFITRIISLACVGTLLTLLIVSPALALTVSPSDIDTTHMVEDMIVDSSGNIHVVAIASVGGGASYNLINKKYTSGSWTTTTIDTGDQDVSYNASIDLDSTGKPAIAWVEWNDTANTQVLYYRKYDGSSWGTDTNTVTVETGMDDFSGKPALEFYKDGADANYPTIFTCHGSTYVVEEHKANGSGTEPAFNTPISVTSDNTHGCSSVEAYLSSTDTKTVVSSPEGSNTTAYAYVNSGAGWNASTLFTNVDNVTGSEIFLDNNGNELHATMIDNVASGTDYLMYSKFSSGSWSSQETVASGVQIGENYIDVVVDSGNDVPYVLYFDNVNNLLKYSYKLSGSWTAGTIASGFTLGSPGGNYMNFVAGDYDVAGSKLIVLGTMYLSSGPPFFDFNKYELTDLPTSGGGGGVPEFSHYVYAILLMTIFGLMYKKYKTI